MQRRECGIAVWVQVGVDRRGVVADAPPGDGLVGDLVHLLRKLEPGRRAGEEKVSQEGQKRHQQQGRDEPPVMLAAAQPESKPHCDRQHEVHEVEKHRNDVLHSDNPGVIEVVLQHQRWNRARKDPALQSRKVMGLEVGFRREPSHRLVGEEQQ